MASIGSGKETLGSFFDRRNKLSINEYTVNLYEANAGHLPTSLIFFIHGGGYTAETWCWLVDELKQALKGPSLLIAYDLRGHGQTTGPTPCHLSLECLCSDAAHIIAEYQELYPNLPSFIIGHSLGGAIATKLLGRNLVNNCLGITLIDIVEETALNSLRHMPEVLEARPRSFPTADVAVKWAMRSKTCRTSATAEISFLSQYKEKEDGSLEIIADLMSSQSFWEGWFEGMSEEFIKIPISRLLVLAETEYLDKTLLIGQMQGHAIQEDQPKQLAAYIANFIDRNLSVHKLNQN